jgi:hypothetical protein
MSISTDPKPFTFAYYRKMLQAVLDDGYKITSFEKYDGGNERTLILRHDVDYTLNGVSQLALIESELGVTATYFFRVHAHEYNCFTPHVYRLIHSLRDLGHEIGLHFEAMTIGRALDVSPNLLLQQEKTVLEAITGLQIQSTSEHRDISQVVHDTGNYHDHFDPLEAGFKNYALENRFFKDMKYLSDSNGIWREGDPTVHLGKYRRFQILVHPDWWFDKDLLLKGPYFHGLGN